MTTETTTSLKGQFLIAMPGMEDSRFQKTVIYVCEHSPAGTMGIVINRPIAGMSFMDILQQVQILDNKDATPVSDRAQSIIVHRGGPVETKRGFVLHSSDYHIKTTTHRIDREISMTETLEVLKAIVRGDGPERVFVALGYAGWSAGQLENEIQQNGWLNSSATPDLVFSEKNAAKYDLALASLGIDPIMLSTSSGHA